MCRDSSPIHLHLSKVAPPSMISANLLVSCICGCAAWMRRNIGKTQTSIDVPTKNICQAQEKESEVPKWQPPSDIYVKKLLSSLPAKKNISISNRNHSKSTHQAWWLQLCSWTLASILLTKRLKPPASVKQRCQGFFPQGFSPNAGGTYINQVWPPSNRGKWRFISL